MTYGYITVVRERFNTLTTEEKIDRLFNAVIELAESDGLKPEQILVPSEPEQGEEQQSA